MYKEALITYFKGDHLKITKICEKFGFNVKLYNKGNKDLGIKVKNIGVDVYDKFHFIVNNYYNLPDLLLFLTDTSFDDIKKKRVIDFVLENHYILYEKSGFLTGHIQRIKKDDIDFLLDEYKGKKLIKSLYRPYSLWFKKTINENINIKDTYVSKKGVFAVTKDLILSNPIEFYKKILSEIESSSFRGHDSEVTHYWERAYTELFCKNNTKLMFHNFSRYGPINDI